MRSSANRRRLILVAAAAAVAVLSAACGGGSSDDKSAGADVKQDGTASAFPVTISQKLGEVTIPAEPKRVVALDFPSADNALALGVAPIGMAKIAYMPDGIMAWTKAALGDNKPEIFSIDDGFPFETIARLDPDVILATNTYPNIADHWDKLNAIAPVVGHVGEPFKDPWDSGLSQIAKALGRTAEADRIKADVQAKIDKARADHPEFAGKTVSFFNYMAADGLWAISSPDDFSMKFLTQLGFRGAPDAVLKAAAGERRVQISPERYTELDADLVMGTSTKGPAVLDGLTKHATFSKIPAVKRKAYVPFFVGDSTSMVQPSALSLPFAVTELVPKMAQAIAAH